MARKDSTKAGSRRWPLRIFYNILDLAAINAWVLYKDVTQIKISTKDNLTQINFTHIGLVPEVECYDMCVKGWDQYVKGSLLKFITEGEGQPQKKK